ncbi:MAG TPA: hypothetical protein VJ874_06105 [Candidatus Thermoplasmatota archaeon]|nr:hypothetical protein [Candidatus Thermoplasmatota archaeon]
MRAAMLAALCLLILLAFTPGAEARPDPPECVWAGPSVTVGPVTVSSYCGEGPRVSYDPTWCTEQELC